MERYYTVKLVGADAPNGDRIRLETAYARHLEEWLGGRDALLSLCLAAREEVGAQERLRNAGVAATAAVRREEDAMPATARFSLSLWSVEDL